MRRRRCLQALMAAGVTGLNGCAAPHGSALARARVLVVGGGYAGATAAKYLRLLSDQAVDVTLVEPNPHLVSCPVSNLVIGGLRTLDDITLSYERLSSRHGVRRVQDRVVAIDPQRRTATLAGGERLGYDRLVLAPGVDFLWDRIEGLKAAHDEGRVLHAWKAGPETLALARQIEAMPDGGTFVMVIPDNPFRCPPGPYERAAMVAHYFKQHKPRSKVLLLDAKDNFSKKALFLQGWKALYGDMVEWVSYTAAGYAALPARLEGGTPNVAGAVGLAAAARFIDGIGREAIDLHVQTLRAQALAGLSALEGVTVLAPHATQASLVSFVARDVHPHDIGTLLDERGIAVRTGHHCAQPLQEHLGLGPTTRASFALYNSHKEVERLIAGVAQALEVMR